MKILLINPPTFNLLSSMLPKSVDESRGYNPPLGLLYLAAYLQKHSNHSVAILDCQVEELNYQQIRERIQRLAPDAIGLTTMTFTLIDVLSIVKLIKETHPQIKTILGGPHIDIYPQETISLPGVDYCVFDVAVNSGPGRAIKFLQSCVGTTPDGGFGPATLAAVKKAEEDPAKLIEAYCFMRLEFLKSLKTYETFGKGWKC